MATSPSRSPSARSPGKVGDPSTGNLYGARLQIIFLGLLAFCGPGMFNALNGLGGAGSDDPTLAAIANTALYFTFGTSGYLAQAAFNTLGPTPLFVFGGMSYGVYSMCILYSKAIPMLAVIGGVVVGCGAGMFWTAQSALMMLYGTPFTRGGYIALFWWIFNFGGVFGGMLQFGLNYNNSSSASSDVAYWTFILIMIGGAALGGCILADPNKVKREDGTRVVFEITGSPGDEMRAAMEAMKDPFVWRGALFFIASNWFYTYDFSGFNGHQFNMRTRGLNSAIFWFAQMVAAFVFGMLLDAHISPRKRAFHALWITCFSVCGTMILALQGNFQSDCHPDYPGQGWDKGRACTLDFQEAAALWPMIVNFTLGAADAVIQTYALWIIAMVAGDDARKTVAFAAAYKGLQAFGAGAAWMIDASGLVNYKAQGIITIVITLVSCMPILKTFDALDTKKNSTDTLQEGHSSHEPESDSSKSSGTKTSC